MNLLNNLNKQLESFSHDISQLITAGHLEDIIESGKRRQPVDCYGREKAVEFIANRMLCSGKKSVLIKGAPGVGKTLLFSHLADLIIRDEAPLGLKGQRLLLIKTFSIKLFEALVSSNNEEIIFVVDEAHAFIRATENAAKENSTQTEILKTHIGSDRIKLIAFTDRAYYFLDDIAWKRRFFIYSINEMSSKDAIAAFKKKRLQ